MAANKPMSGKTRQKFNIRSYEVDVQSKVKLSSLWNYMQESAWNNASDLGASVFDLHEIGISWVLSRLQLKIHSYPSHKDEIYVETWPSGHSKFFVYRDFRIYSADNSLMAEATSTWIVFDLKTRKLTSLPSQFEEIVNYTKEKALERAEGRIGKIDTPEISKKFRVRWSDVDVNRHVNNGILIQWITETVDDLEIESSRPSYIDIVFKKESRYGDTIASQRKQGDEVNLHELRAEDGVLIAQAAVSLVV